MFKTPVDYTISLHIVPPPSRVVLREAGSRDNGADGLAERPVARRRRRAPAFQRQVDVLQLQLPARHRVAARDLDRLRRRRRAPDVDELHLAHLHRLRLHARKFQASVSALQQTIQGQRNRQ